MDISRSVGFWKVKSRPICPDRKPVWTGSAWRSTTRRPTSSARWHRSSSSWTAPRPSPSSIPSHKNAIVLSPTRFYTFRIISGWIFNILNCSSFKPTFVKTSFFFFVLLTMLTENKTWIQLIIKVNFTFCQWFWMLAYSLNQPDATLNYKWLFFYVYPNDCQEIARWQSLRYSVYAFQNHSLLFSKHKQFTLPRSWNWLQSIVIYVVMLQKKLFTRQIQSKIVHFEFQKL